ncbi:AAA family ATPase [Acinetobacter sp. ANC 4648]|uniref:AAA family ATPase n=1 Tax=Acinetobacter sp. ANC 4648 TaxID=1977875 RepID=UPI00148A45C9|nr:AAA family ATPase [Acinetobacter sp. ANC 4648]
MILGIFLRHIKTYKGINFIPLSDGNSFCGLVGDNGIGKSTILESLDTIFNNRDWNINIEHKSKTKDNLPYILPIFCIEKSKLDNDLDHTDILNIVNKATREITIPEFPSRSKEVSTRVFDHIARFLVNADENDKYYLIPLGVKEDRSLSFGIFERFIHQRLKDNYLLGDDNSDDENFFEPIYKILSEIWEKILGLYNYIYIPKELSAEDFTKLHNKEFQILMGKTLTETLDTFIPQNFVQKINDNLDQIITAITEDLDFYTYRTIHTRQQKLKKADIYQLITDAYFGIRHIHQRFNTDSWIPISKLSSGEKQKAILNIAHTLLIKKQSSNKDKYVILGFDEPESSLHISACFDVFQQLYDTSKYCNQLIFTTHWYGFLPAVIDGNTVIISRNDNQDHQFDFINIYKYREETKQAQEKSGKNNKLPSSIKLKSVNDLVQSIICGSMGEEPFNWIICEGSSEKVYFNYFFSDLIENNRLRILPVGSYKEVKRLYNHLSIAFQEFKDEITGKVYLLCDTDKDLDNKYTPLQENQHPNLRYRRFVNNTRNGTTRLEVINTSVASDPTELEDVLNAKTFVKTLEQFKDDFPKELKLLEPDIYEVFEENEFLPSAWAFSLSPPNRIKLMKFFDTNKGEMKVQFAKKYIQNVDDINELPWINDIKKFLIST